MGSAVDISNYELTLGLKGDDTATVEVRLSTTGSVLLDSVPKAIRLKLSEAGYSEEREGLFVKNVSGKNADYDALAEELKNAGFIWIYPF